MAENGSGSDITAGGKLMKKKRRIILPIVAAVLCYIALGAVLPFVYQPAVKEETKEQTAQDLTNQMTLFEVKA